MSSNTQKLRVLRARTDHDLITLIRRELDRGFVLVNVAVSRNSPLFSQAEKAWQTASMLLPKIQELPQDARSRMECELKQLRSLLDQVPTCVNPGPYRAYVAS